MFRIKRSDNLRKCTQCKQLKPATNEFFYKDKTRYLGLGYKCKGCEKQRIDTRIYSERKLRMTPKQIEKRIITIAKYNRTEKVRVKSLFNAYKKYDIKKGYINTLVLNDVIKARNSIVYIVNILHQVLIDR